MDSENQYISQKELAKVYKKELKSLGNISDIKEKGDIRKSVFLSHSHLDKTIVSKITALLKKLNTDIYVDWLDQTMPEITSEVTAQNIKDKIEKCHKFLFLATYHGIRSKWCMWELGIADTLKGNSNLAILPIESNSGNWRGSEYVKLYSEMKFKTDLDNVVEDDVFIKQGTKEISLKNWLDNK
jgi:hypothetical protein